MVTGIPQLKKEHGGFCKGCALGKNVKKPFTSNDTRSNETLDLIHFDVCGPMSKKSLSGKGHSRNTWIYLLKSKDEVFEKFQEFKAEIENMTKRKIKTLRSENGGEYTSRELMAFWKEAGIKRELIVPYNPQQNVVAERKNRSIEECVRAMLHYQEFPKFLWGESSVTTVYIKNRSPHRILDNMTPKESFTRKKPNVDNLRIFGCHVYIHIPKDKRKKLDLTGMKGIFVGYVTSSKAYRVYIKE